MTATSAAPASQATARNPRNAPPTVLFWIVACPPILGLILAFIILPTSLFRKYGEHFWVTAQEGLYLTSGDPCQVLIFGDSTAMTGLDPAIISRKAHLRTCNVAQTQGALDVNGIAPLDRYLRRNPRPAILLLQFSADDLDPVPVPGEDAEHMDGFIPFLTHGNRYAALGRMIRSPDTFTGLLQFVYLDGARDLRARFVTHHFALESPSEGSYIVIPLPSPKTCTPPAASRAVPDANWIHYLRVHYSPMADRVLLNLSPLTPCDPYYEPESTQLRPLIDNRLEVFPQGDFVDGDHLNRTGAIRLSDETADQISRVAGQAYQPVSANLFHGPSASGSAVCPPGLTGCGSNHPIDGRSR